MGKRDIFRDLLKKIKFRAYFSPKQLIFANVVLIVLIFYKKLFFMALFAILNWWVLSIKPKYGFHSPIEVMSFGTIMCGYVYGTLAAILVASSSVIALVMTARLEVDKIIVNVIVFFIGYLAHIAYTLNIPIFIAGPALLAVRYIIEFTVKLGFLGDASQTRHLPLEAMNLIFYIVIYSSFGETLIKLMSM